MIPADLQRVAISAVEKALGPHRAANGRAALVWEDPAGLNAVVASREVIFDMTRKTSDHLGVTEAEALERFRALEIARQMPSFEIPIILWIGENFECVPHTPTRSLS